MSFLDTLTQQSSGKTPQQGALLGAVAALTLDGDLVDVERRIISLFRDQFPPLSTVDETVFTQTLDRATELIRQHNPAGDIAGFVRSDIAAAITNPADRLAAYRYIYSLAMADLNLSPGETTLLTEMQSQLNLNPADCNRVEQEVLAEFRDLHQALASTALGLIVVTADGNVQQSELDSVRTSRNVLDPIGALDDVQFQLVFDLALNIHDRFLLDPENRKAFLENILAQMLNTPAMRREAFAYAAAVATADGNLAQSEVDALKELLIAMNINDAEGEAIFNQHMGRVKTIDGKPRA